MDCDCFCKCGNEGIAEYSGGGFALESVVYKCPPCYDANPEDDHDKAYHAEEMTGEAMEDVYERLTGREMGAAA